MINAYSSLSVLQMSTPGTSLPQWTLQTHDIHASTKSPVCVLPHCVNWPV